MAPLISSWSEGTASASPSEMRPLSAVPAVIGLALRYGAAVSTMLYCWTFTMAYIFTRPSSPLRDMKYGGLVGDVQQQREGGHVTHLLT